jgi:hypothetical protein
MSDTAIYEGFAALVETFAAAQGLPCAYPGVGFTPPTEGAWLELQWFPNQTQNYGIGDDGPFLRQGFGQLSACYRPGGGIVTGTRLTDQIIAAFGKGTEFAGARVYRLPWTSSIIPDPERIMHPVTIAWRGLFGG